jgi:O-acetylserine/cysteine efflux transporter
MSAPARPVVLVGATLLLFLLWSNSFVAMSYLLGTEAASQRLDWASLTVARYLPVTPLAAAWLAWRRRDEARRILREEPLRVLACGLLGVPFYGFALYWGIQHGIPAPIASLLTALSPLCLLGLGWVFLGERPSGTRLVGFAIAVSGLVAVAVARGGGTLSGLAAPAVAALAPIAWAIQTALTKPVAARFSGDGWTAMYLFLGGLPLCVISPWVGGRALLALDGAGLLALGYLALLCTFVGFYLWAWLLERLPASTVGMTVFLNPPLALLSQAVLHRLFPGTFRFTLRPLEVVGMAVVLGGLALAVAPRGGRPGAR